jgi:hypothetical protein
MAWRALTFPRLLRYTAKIDLACRMDDMKLVQLTLIGQGAVPVFVNPDQVVSLVALPDRTSIVTTATSKHGVAIVYDVTELAGEVVRLLTVNPGIAAPGRA